MIYVWLFLFVSVVFSAWILNFFGIPGNWGMLAAALVWFLFSPAGYEVTWQALVVLGLLALAGEGFEFLASVFGTKKVGGSKKGASLSVVGSIIGGIAGAIMGVPIPIPVIGILIGSVLFACIGAMVGAMIGEHWDGKPMNEMIKIGGAAFVGRLLGTAGKIGIGAGMLLLTVLAPFFEIL